MKVQSVHLRPGMKPQRNLALALLVLASVAGPGTTRAAEPATAGHAPRVKVAPLRVPGGVVQLTGKNLRVGQTRFRKRGPADPFAHIAADGSVAIYGTVTSVPRGGKHTFVRFSSFEAMERGGPYTTEKLDLEPALTGKEMAWDFSLHRWPDGTDVLYAGVMTPTARRTVHAKWPDDNWTRRIYAFAKNAKGKWVMRGEPLFNPVTRATPATMIGHAYGHDFKTVTVDSPAGPVTETWLFHEEISGEIQTPAGPRLKTEIFARKMLDPFTASTRRVKIFGVGSPARHGARASGDHTVEGPRPFEVTIEGEKVHFIAFSGGDFYADNYDVNFAYRKGSAIGPYAGLTSGQGPNRQLIAYAKQIKEKYGLSWVGRPQVIARPDGTFRALFHGVSKAVLPGGEYTGTKPAALDDYHRNIYLVPIEFKRGRAGVPEIRLVGEPEQATPGLGRELAAAAAPAALSL